MVYLYILFFIFIIIYLVNDFGQLRNSPVNYALTENNSIIEFLTKHKLKNKNYKQQPGNYCTYNRYFPSGKIIDDKVQMRYEFPLIKSNRAVYDTFLYPEIISKEVDKFGLETNLIIKGNDGFNLNPDVKSNELKIKMNTDGWYYNSNTDYGVDYKYLVNTYSTFSKSIAVQIYNELLNINEDSYFNRIQAALNFVQFLPYGLPEFDTPNWYYFGIATPPESLILGYSDCDSKSVLFASILCHLIPIENIILVNCSVNSSNESENGEHMMVAVSNMGINGQMIVYNNKSYLLLEITSPIEIGKFNWDTFKSKEIISLV